MQNLPLQIREARERLTLTQHEVAKRGRVSLSIVGKLERGIASPSTRVLARIAEALGYELAIELRPKKAD